MFFAIVAVIDNQELFTPIINWVMTYEGHTQTALFYCANGLLSMISDDHEEESAAHEALLDKMKASGECVWRDSND